MDIWEKMYEEAQKLYNPHEVSDFVYANHVVAAVEAEDGQIFTGFCMEETWWCFPSLRRAGSTLQYVPIFRTN